MKTGCGIITFLMSCLTTSVWLIVTMTSADTQNIQASKELDLKVEKFLDENRGRWHDWNVPY